jgi:hypothetical protein
VCCKHNEIQFILFMIVQFWFPSECIIMFYSKKRLVNVVEKHMKLRCLMLWSITIQHIMLKPPVITSQKTQRFYLTMTNCIMLRKLIIKKFTIYLFRFPSIHIIHEHWTFNYTATSIIFHIVPTTRDIFWGIRYIVGRRFLFPASRSFVFRVIKHRKICCH